MTEPTTPPRYVFVDHMPSSRLGTVLDFAEACRAQAGRWGLYPRALTVDQADHLSRAINAGDAEDFGDGYVARLHEGRVFVRYVGADQ